MEKDRALVKEILNGRPERFEDLIRKYHPRVCSFIIKMGASTSDAEDMAQETFIKVYKNLFKYNERWEFSTWVFQIALNTYRDFCRKKKPETRELDSCPSAVDSPEIFLEQQQRKEMVKSMLDKLDADTRSMVVFYYFNEMTLKEIGRIFGSSPEAVKMKIYRARKKLGNIYDKYRTGGVTYEM